MNFILFLLACILYYFFYWYVLSIIIGLPTISMMKFADYLINHNDKKWARSLFVPTTIIGFIVGTILPCALYGMGIGLVSLYFSGKANHPIIYNLIGGVGAFTIIAPSRETSFPGMLISLAAYIITILIPKFAIFSGISIATIFYIAMWGTGILILIGIIVSIVKFLDDKISKRNKSESEITQENKKISTGVKAISIIFIIFGGLWILNFLILPINSLLTYFFWGVPLLISGIGMLKKKYWALRVGQVVFILFALQCLILIPLSILNDTVIDIYIILIALFVLIITIGLPLWYLFKKSTVNQFKKLQ